MNSKNKVIRFLKSWQDRDYQAMEGYAVGKVNESLFGDFTITGFGTPQKTTAVGRNKRVYNVSLSTNEGDLNVPITVILEPGPFEDRRPSGVVIEQLEDSLPKSLKSTDMSAKEAINYIKDQPAKKAKNFVSEKEERVTVLDALESKK